MHKTLRKSRRRRVFKKSGQCVFTEIWRKYILKSGHQCKSKNKFN